MHHIQQALIQPRIEIRPAARIRVVVPAVVAAVGVEVAAEFYDELEGEGGAGGEGGEFFDGGDAVGRWEERESWRRWRSWLRTVILRSSW